MNTDLKDRTREFALRIVRVCAALPRNRTSTIVSRQLLRAGTSPGAHFREALHARSKAEYVAKMNVGVMELEETLYWLEIVEGTGLLKPLKLRAIEQETRELMAIFISLINKWRSK
jgi:four helix bundle protein